MLAIEITAAKCGITKIRITIMFNRTTRRLLQPQGNLRFFSQAFDRFDKVSKHLLGNLSEATRNHILNPENVQPPAALTKEEKTYLLDYIRINLMSNFHLSAFANLKAYYNKQTLSSSSNKSDNSTNIDLAILVLVESFPQTFVVDYASPSPLHLVAYHKQPADDALLAKIQPLCSAKLLRHLDFLGNTVLHSAALNRHHSLIKWLVAQGASPALANKEGLSAIQCFNKAVGNSINPHRSEIIDGTLWRWTDKHRPATPSPADIKISNLLGTYGHNEEGKGEVPSTTMKT